MCPQGYAKFRLLGHSVFPDLLPTATVTPRSLWPSLGCNCSWSQRHFLTGPEAGEVNLAEVQAWLALPVVSALGLLGRTWSHLPQSCCTARTAQGQGLQVWSSEATKGPPFSLIPATSASVQAQEGEGCQWPSIPQDLPDPFHRPES